MFTHARYIFIAVVFFTLSAQADSLTDIESLLLSGDYSSANQKIKDSYRDKYIVTTPKVKLLSAYERISSLFQAEKSFSDAYGLYEESPKSEADYSKLKSSYSAFSHAHFVIKNELPVSQELVERVNAITTSVKERFNATTTAYASTQEQRRIDLKAAQDKSQEEALAQQAAREAEIKAERQRTAKLVKEQRSKRSTQLEALNQAATQKGYKGLSQEYGIGRFLYKASRSGSLESGLDKVFWTKLTSQDEKVDSKWRLAQVVEGWELYEIHEWSGGEWVNMTIAVPASKALPIEGQKLKGEFYVFKGNVQFSTVLGANRIVQKFEPVQLHM